MFVSLITFKILNGYERLGSTRETCVKLIAKKYIIWGASIKWFHRCISPSKCIKQKNDLSRLYRSDKGQGTEMVAVQQYTPIVVISAANTASLLPLQLANLVVYIDIIFNVLYYCCVYYNL